MNLEDTTTKTKTNLKRIFRTAFFIASMSLISGCITGGSFFGNKPTESKIISSSLPEKCSNIKNAELIIDNLSVQQETSEGYVKIKGNAICSYDLTEWEKWTEIWEFTDYHVYGIIAKREVEREEAGPIKTKHIEDTPSLLEVYINGLNYPGKLAMVNADGSFETVITHPKLKKPKSWRYYNLWYNQLDVRAKVSREDTKIPEKTYLYSTGNSVKIGEVKVNYEHKPDKEAIREFVDSEINSNIFLTVINSKDQITHLPVSSKIEIECVNSPDIFYELKREFQDEMLYNIAKEYVKKCLTEGEKYEIEGQTISFNTIQNAQYMIQTFNPNYHYFRAIFTADKSSKEKTILLVEKGEKVRIDTTKEGEGMLINE